MSSHSSESESGEEAAVGEDLKGQEEIHNLMTAHGGSNDAGASRILELLQEERENGSGNGKISNGAMSQGYRKIQQQAEEMSDDSSAATPQAKALMGSPDGSVVSFQDDTPSVQVGDLVSHLYPGLI